MHIIYTHTGTWICERASCERESIEPGFKFRQSEEISQTVREANSRQTERNAKAAFRVSALLVVCKWTLSHVLPTTKELLLATASIWTQMEQTPRVQLTVDLYSNG